MGVIINSKIPPFNLQAYSDGVFKVVTDKDLLGTWSVLFFYLADFSPFCFKELKGLIDRHEEFKSVGVQIYSISTDSHFVHKAWCNLSDDVKAIDFPMIADPAFRLTSSLGVLNEETGMAYRSIFIVNPSGLIKIAELHDGDISHNIDELLWKIKAAQFVEQNVDKACPARWKDGDKAIEPTIDLVGKL